MESTEKEYATFLGGVKACVPTIMGYIGIGIAAGVVGNSSGLSVLEIALIAILVYAGSAQFIISGMLAVQSPISAIIFTTFLVNLRHFLMSLSVAAYFKQNSLLNSIGIGSLLTDESYGVLMTAIQEKKPVTPKWVHGLNTTAYLTWISATVVGGFVGSWLPNPEVFGLDFALVAMFIGLVVLQVNIPLKRKFYQTLLVIAAVAISLYLLMAFCSPETAVLLATLIGCAMGVKLFHGSI